MQVHIWGSRGSLPASITAKMTEAKIFRAIKASRSVPLETDEAIMTFIRKELPFSTWGSYGGNTSCVEIKGLKEYVFCDAGTGLRDFGHWFTETTGSQRESLPNVFHIFMSHLHWDHIQGFPFFTPAYMPGCQIHIYGCHNNLEEAFANQQEMPHFPVPLKAMRADISFHRLNPGETYDIAGLAVTGIKQDHPGDSYGYRFENQGTCIVYSSDAEHKDDAEKDNYRFIDFFRGADLLIFDAQYTYLDTIDIKENWGHSSNLMGVELAVQAGVKRLCLFHSEHTFDDEALDRFLNDTRQYLKIYAPSCPLEILLAYDGLVLEI